VLKQLDSALQELNHHMARGKRKLNEEAKRTCSYVDAWSP